MTQEEFWIWLAGFVDGDGSIDIKKGRDGFGAGCTILLNVCNTDRPTLVFCQKMIGFGKIQKLKVRSMKHKPVYDWRCTGEKARKIIQEMYPYLITKKKEADIALQFITTRTYLKLPPKETEKRKILFDQMKKLVKRGNHEST